MKSATQTLPGVIAPGQDDRAPARAEAPAQIPAEGEARAEALWRAAAAERAAGRWHDALFLYEQAAPLFDGGADHARRGDFCAAYADLLAALGEAEGRSDYLERARAEYAAAALHFGRAGRARRQAAAEHGLGRLFLSLADFAEAHRHLARALSLLGGADDAGEAARVGETRARLLLAEGRAAEAEELSAGLARALETAGEPSLLSAVLTVQGAARARLGRHGPAHDSFLRAAEAARQAGDAEAEGQAALALAEELSEHLPLPELAESFERAASLLSPSPARPAHARLCACARRLISQAAEGRRQSPRGWEGFSLKEAVHRFEAGIIGRALSEAGGSVSRAAHLLGFRHHNSLASILNNRHRELLAERSPIKPRRRSIITVREPAHAPRFADAGAARAATVLHVEDDAVVADAVRGTLEAEGWRVETCADGGDALARLRRATPYDLLLLDYDLPGADGATLAREARSLRHRRATPIIMFSGTDRERESLEAGVDLFLRKPQDSASLAAAVRRLLPKKSSRQ
ncbi:MAG TPA: response regulator [Pyrinomonadaceae bacterium]|nr:response regulator [Pyrinomonadaceae bacterium]